MILQLTNENFDKEVKQSDIPVIIDFWASWCGPCQMMGPVFEEMSGDYEGKLKFTKLSTENFPQLAGEYGIQSIPCLIITKEGKEVDRIVGFAPAPVMKQKIDAILSQL